MSKNKRPNGTQPHQQLRSVDAIPADARPIEPIAQVPDVKPKLTADITIAIRDGVIQDPVVVALGGAVVTFGDMKTLFSNLATHMDQQFFKKATQLGALVYQPEKAAETVAVPAPVPDQN